MKMKHSSSCTCGNVKLIAESDPYRVSICHCFACQKRTESVFGVQARFKRSGITVEGKTTEYVREADSKNMITFHFCPTCGSTVYWFLASQPDMIGTGVGNFTDTKFPTPTVAVFEHRKHDWVDTSYLKIERHNKISQ
jgi:hypothetical protein